MRRSIFVLAAAAVSSFALLGCEDGPNQTYTPSPAGAATNWNNSGAPGATSGAQQGFGGGSIGGNNAEVICTGSEKAKRWATMVKEPVVPPRYAGGLDMAGGESWPGLTITEAEKVNCQSDSLGDIFGQSGILSNSWGDNQEVIDTYYVSNNKAWMIYIWNGYTGGMGCNGLEPGDSPSGPCQPLQSPDKAHTYFIPLGSQVQKDNANFEIDWQDPVAGPAELNELAAALMFTYAPQLPAEPNCIGDGHCLMNTSQGDVPYFFILPLGIAISPASKSAAQPVPSIMTNFQLYVTKVLGFAYANPLLKLDQVGPQATAGILGTATTPCTLQFGMQYGEFLANCVQTTGDANKNAVELNKLIGGIQHGDEDWGFNVQGVDMNFKSSTLAPTAVLGDNALPQPSDLSVEMSIDQSTLGNILNDYSDPAGQKLDLHGSGAVYKEYARLVRQDVLAALGGGSCSLDSDCGGVGAKCNSGKCAIIDGDPSLCLFPDTKTAKAFPNPTTSYCASRRGNPSTCTLPAYCTGFEGFVTGAPSTGPTDLTNLGVSVTSVGAGTPTAAVPNPVNKLALGLKPGNIYAYFCGDANGPAGLVAGAGGATTGYNLCGVNNDAFGNVGPLWKTSYNQLLRVAAGNNGSVLPATVQDIRFFWKEFVTALLKYMTVAGNPGPVPDLSAIKLDGYSLFFDSNGAGQFETAEYVDRRFVSATQAPLDVSVTADVKGGIFNDFDFTRWLARGETAVYAAMTVNANDAPGAENTAVITNVVGNPILSTWPAGTVSTAYTCATTFPQPTDCPPLSIPLDAKGNPVLNSEGDYILKPYPGAIGTTAATSFTLGPVGVAITQTYENSQQAMVSIPVHSNPYDQSSPPGPNISKLLPWVPKQPGNGFNIPLNGELNQFITTSNVDLSGITISAYVYYDCQIDTSTGQCMSNGAIQFDAMYSTDFLGDVFLCKDTTTGDLLTAQMYTSVGDMLAFLAAHPNVYTDCGLIIRYSPFDNYADYITSLNNGVQVQVTQGGGYGRIVGATMFVPGQGNGQ
jgi:hypothetical protein